MKESISEDSSLSEIESELGIPASENPELIILQKKSKLLSRLSLLLFVIALTFGIYAFSERLLMAGYIDLTMSVLFLTSFLLNRKRKFYIAKITLLLSYNLSLVLFCYSYPLDTGLYFLFIPAMVLAVVLFGSKDKITNHFFILLPVFEIIAVFNIAIPFVSIIPLSPEERAHSLRVNLTASLAQLSFALYWLVNLTSQTEQWLSDIVKRTVNKSRELEKANKELDKFIYRTSHDLRSPLSSVKGLVTIATHETHDSTALRFLKEIVQNIERLDSFTKEIIEYSKNALTEVMLETVNFQILVTETVDSLKYMTEAAPIHFLFNIDSNIDALADRRRIRIVLHNLIGNAIKYHDTKKTYQYIEIRIRKTDTDLVLTVADNGTGISPQYRSKIFDMFYRGTSTSNGSGLGLYIVKEAVEKMNGVIEVESNPGSGSMFTVTIPAGLTRFRSKSEVLQFQN